MSLHETVETVFVETKNGPVRINKDDFDPKVHKLVGEKQEEDAFDRKGAMAFLEERNVEFAKNISNDKLKALVEETENAVKKFQIVQKDEKFIIADADGNQVGSDAYDSQEDAETMLNMLTGE